MAQKNLLASKIVLGIFVVGSAVLLIGKYFDKSGGPANYSVQLEQVADGWISRVTVINESADRYHKGGLGRITLNGQPTTTVLSNYELKPKEKRTFEIKFPPSAAKAAEISTLTCWVDQSRFASWQSRLHSHQLYPLDEEEKQELKRRPPANPQDPFLQILPSRRGWICRFMFKNDGASRATYSVQRCWLNGRESIQGPGEWMLLPGQWVARDLFFPLEAAKAGSPAEFDGWYQVERGSGDNRYDMRPIRATLHP